MRPDWSVDRMSASLKRKTCLRCDWQGTRRSAPAPRVGSGRSIWSTLPVASRAEARRERLGSVRPGSVRPPRRAPPRRRPSLPAIAGSAPSQTDIERSLGRSDRVVVPLMVVALVLTIAVGMWFTGRAQQPRTQDAVGAGYFARVPSPTSAVPSAAPTDAGLVGQPASAGRCSPSGTCRCR